MYNIKATKDWFKANNNILSCTKSYPRINAIKKVVNVNPEHSTTGGTSDARFITKLCPVIEFGLVGKTMHKIDENVEVDDIMKLTSIYNKFLQNYFRVEKND